MTISLDTVMAVVVPVILAVTWLLRLEGRITLTDARYLEIIRRLERIEMKEDQKKT